MTLAANMLVLGTRRDAVQWRDGCRRVGMTILPDVREPRPGLPSLRALFRTSPDWIFFGGHFDGRGLFNDRELWGMEETAVVIALQTTGVRVTSHRKRATLRKDRGEFALHSQCKVTFWGGCNVASDTGTLSTIHALFGQHVVIGFSDTTSPRLMSAVIGTARDQGDFFGKLGGDLAKVTGATVRDAWFEAVQASAAARSAYARYRVVDESGQEWRLQRKRPRGLEVVAGRKVSP